MAKSKGKKRARREFSGARGLLWLWAGLLTAPLAFLLHLEVNYALVTQLCQSDKKAVSHLLTLAALLVAAGGGFVAWRNWESTGREMAGEAATVTERSRLMAAVGLFISALVVLALIAQWIPQFIFDPCQR